MGRFLLLAVIMVALLLFFVFQYFGFPEVTWFIFVGITVGLYYGFFNNDVFHKSGKFNNEFEKVHSLYIHLVCGLVGSLCLFVLYTRFPFSNAEPSIGDLSLLIFGILGIVGLLPRSFWFLANSANLLLKQ